MLYKLRRNHIKNFLTDDKIIGMGSLYHSSCKAVDETIELFTDMKPRGMV